MRSGKHTPQSKIEEIDTMDDDEKKRHQRYYKQKNLLKEWVNSFARTEAKKFLEEVEQAKELRGKVFYQRVKVGHNGRIYFPEGLSYQGIRFCKSSHRVCGWNVPLESEDWQIHKSSRRKCVRRKGRVLTIASMNQVVRYV